MFRVHFSHKLTTTHRRDLRACTTHMLASHSCSRSQYAPEGHINSMLAADSEHLIG